MILSFTLSMPNVGSWNGKWSGEGRPYVITRKFGKAKTPTAKAREISEKKYYHYNFGDGWSAGINVREVTAKEAAQLRKKSVGFCGYEWMVDSIIAKGQIEP